MIGDGGLILYSDSVAIEKVLVVARVTKYRNYTHSQIRTEQMPHSACCMAYDMLKR